MRIKIKQRLIAIVLAMVTAVYLPVTVYAWVNPFHAGTYKVSGASYRYIMLHTTQSICGVAHLWWDNNTTTTSDDIYIYGSGPVSGSLDAQKFIMNFNPGTVLHTNGVSSAYGYITEAVNVISQPGLSSSGISHNGVVYAR